MTEGSASKAVTALAVPAAIVGALNMGLLVIPGALLLPQLIGLDGVILTRPLAQVITLAVTVVLGTRVLGQSLKASPEEVIT